MVPVPEEASPIGKTTSNASCIEGGHIASTLPDNGMEQWQGAESRAAVTRDLWMDDG